VIGRQLTMRREPATESVGGRGVVGHVFADYPIGNAFGFANSVVSLFRPKALRVIAHGL
jgi:hypothetical protein